nr:unnamed protein product [Digitaria exilis]
MAAQLHDLLRRLCDEASAAVPPRAAVVFVLATTTLFFLVLLPLLFRHLTASTASPKDDSLLSKLPSPPNKLPIIGHLHLMGPFPPISLAALAAKHSPDLMLLRLGTVPTIVVSSPRAAEAILRTHDHIFSSRPKSMVAEAIVYGQCDSCYSPYGDHFRNVRKVVTVHLLSSNKVMSYRPAREEEVRLVVAKLRLAAVEHAVVDMSEVLNSFKFFREEGRNKMFCDLIDTTARLFGGFNLEDYFPRLARVGPIRKMLCANARKTSQRWDKLIEEIIGEHEARAAQRHHEEEDDSDFIDVLLSRQHEYGLTRDHIKAILIMSRHV